MQDLQGLVQLPPSPTSVVFLGFGAVVHSWHGLGRAEDAAWHHPWEAVGLEPSLSASLSRAGASITLHSARSWDEFSSVSGKTIPELRNPQPINPGKLCRPGFLKSALITCLLWLLICISCSFLHCYQGCDLLHLATSGEEVINLSEGPREHSLNPQFPPGYESCAVPGRFGSVPQPPGTDSPMCQHPAAHFVHLHVLYVSTQEILFPMPFKCQSSRCLSKIEIYRLNREAGLLSLLLGAWSLSKYNFHRRLPGAPPSRCRVPVGSAWCVQGATSRSTRISSKFKVSSAFAKVEHDRSPALHLLVLARSGGRQSLSIINWGNS